MFAMKINRVHKKDLQYTLQQNIFTTCKIFLFVVLKIRTK